MSSISIKISKSSRQVFLNPHFWGISGLIILLSAFYYLVQLNWIAVFEYFPWLRVVMIWEYTNKLNGILLYIPFIYASIIFWWRGALLTWLISLIILAAHLTAFTPNGSALFFNIAILSLPMIVVCFISLELNWREKERKFTSDREKERQVYLSQVFRTQEEERTRVAQELHDDPIQRLSALAIDAEVLTSQETVKNSPDIRGAVNSFRESVISISQDLRRISLDLRPDLIDDLGLIPSLRWLLDRFRQGSDIAAQLNVEGENRNPIPKKISDNLFRIVQEALNNVKRHSLARSVLVNVQLTDSKIQISVQDDGRGFNFQRSYAKLASEGKLGLIGMQQRVQFINGSFSCQSEADKGTTITVEVELG